MWAPDTAQIVTAEQKAAALLAARWDSFRAERDNRLSASDWTQLPDAPDANRAAWAAYRQALRDLPDATADPAIPAWPQAPEPAAE